MRLKFTKEQLAAAPSAWVQDGQTRLVSVTEVPPLSWRFFGKQRARLREARHVACPVLSSTEGYDVVVLPDGSRLTLHR